MKVGHVDLVRICVRRLFGPQWSVESSAFGITSLRDDGQDRVEDL